MLLIIGHPVRRGVGRLEDLMSLPQGLAKLAINRSWQWAMEEVVTANCLLLFCDYVCAQVSLEKEHAVSINTLGVAVCDLHMSIAVEVGSIQIWCCLL
eukprot:g47118.t1